MLKKRSSVIFIVIVLIVIIVAAFVIFTYSGGSGTKEGDVFIYDIKCYSSSQNSEAAPTESFVQYNLTELFKVTVTEVSGADILLTTVWHFTNGTEIEESSTINVETGVTYPSGSFWAIYLADLEAGDNVRPLGADRSTINATATRDYASGTRETNRISLVLSYCDANNTSTTWTEYMNIHFDKKTGVLVELRDTNVYTNPDITLTIIWTIKDTNVWSVS